MGSCQPAITLEPFRTQGVDQAVDTPDQLGARGARDHLPGTFLGIELDFPATEGEQCGHQLTALHFLGDRLNARGVCALVLERHDVDAARIQAARIGSTSQGVDNLAMRQRYGPLPKDLLERRQAVQPQPPHQPTKRRRLDQQREQDETRGEHGNEVLHGVRN